MLRTIFASLETKYKFILLTPVVTVSSDHRRQRIFRSTSVYYEALWARETSYCYHQCRQRESWVAVVLESFCEAFNIQSISCYLSLSAPPENIRKPIVSKGIKDREGTSGMRWVRHRFQHSEY